MHGLEHWTHFYTDYGRELQRLLRPLPQGRGQRLGPTSRRCSSTSATWTAPSRSAASRPGRWSAPSGPASPRPDSRLPQLGRAAAASWLATTRPATGVTSTGPLPEQDTEITGPLAAKLFVASTATDADLFLVVRVFDPDGEEVVFHGALDPHIPVAQGWLRASHRKLDLERSRALPALPHPRRGAAAATGHGLRASTSRSGRRAWSSRPATASACP